MGSPFMGSATRSVQATSFRLRLTGQARLRNTSQISIFWGALMDAMARTAAEPSPVETISPPLHYLDLKAQFHTIRGEVLEAIGRVMESQHFILGSEVDQFESELAAALGVRYAVTCASGSDALVLAMMAGGIGPGDEVITTPFTFIATGGSIARVGAKPVFVDIDPDTLNIQRSEE